MNIVMLRWFYVEIIKLIDSIKKLVKSYLKADFLAYLKYLFLGKNKKLISIFFRILFFWIIILLKDIIIILFRFYYLIMFWFFSNLKFWLRFYTSEEFWINFFSKIINFVQYFLLLMPIVRLEETLKKKKKKLYMHLIDRTLQTIIRIIWWKPKLRAKLAIPIEVFEFMAIFFGVIPSAILIMLIAYPIIDVLEIIFNHFTKWRLFFGIINHVRQYNKIAGVSYLRHGASLFHISLMLQKQGFEAPKSSTFDKLKARLEYKEYRKKYKKAELTPETLDDKAIDIYVVLLDLFSETRYELKRLPLKEFFLIIFPYEILVNLFFFSFYFYIGLCYLLAIIFFPLVLVNISWNIFDEIYKRLKVIHFLFFHDLDYLASEKDKIWTKIREDALKEESIERKQWYKHIRETLKKLKKK